MLMAAGLGTRLRPFTELHPKALLPLMGIPMAQFAVDMLRAAGVRSVVANVHHHAEKAKAGLYSLDLNGLSLGVSDESDLLLGSAGGIRKAAPAFGAKPFFLVNADVVSDIDLGHLAIHHQKLRARWGVTLTLAVRLAGPRGGKYREILFNPETELVTGLGQHQEEKPFFTGAAVIESEALRHVPPQGPSEFVPTILEPAMREGKVGVFLTDCTWFDIGDPGLWLQAHTGIIERLETGALNQRWRERIESLNKRISPLVWVSKDSPHILDPSGWIGPAYWNRLEEETAHPPRELGPEAVIYGGGFPGGAIRDKIVYRGLSA